MLVAALYVLLAQSDVVVTDPPEEKKDTNVIVNQNQAPPVVVREPPPAVSEQAPVVVVADQDVDRPRFRSGLSLHGGYTAGGYGGPGGAVSARLGIQANRIFGLYVQAMPQLFALLGGDPGLGAGVSVNNSLLASFIIADHFELAVGPSLDYLSTALIEADGPRAGGRGWGFGMHGRAAVNFGQRNPNGGSRSGVSLALDLHPVFVGATPSFMSTLGVGIDWY